MSKPQFKIVMNDNTIRLVDNLYDTKLFAITGTIDQNSYSYTITHKETGYAVVRFSDKTKAIKLCNLLNRTFKDITNNKEEAKLAILNFCYKWNIKNFHLTSYNY